MIDDVVLEELDTSVPTWRAALGGITVAVVGFVVAVTVIAILLRGLTVAGVPIQEGQLSIGSVTLALIGLPLGYKAGEWVGIPVAERLWLTPAERADRRRS